MKKLPLLFLSWAAVVFFAGCATPETRISHNPEFFSKLSTEDQQRIREGRVAVGFTPEMVRLALGDPDRVFTRTNAKGSSEVWSYTTYEGDDGIVLYRGFYHRSWRSPYYYPYYMDYPDRVEREYLKVVFTAGRVSEIEQRS